MGIKTSIRSLVEALPLFTSILRHGRPSHIFRFDGGIGDDFLCSAIVLELKGRGAANIWMLTDYPDLFTHNPHVTLVARKSLRGVRRFIEIFGFTQTKLGYAEHVGGRDLQPRRHAILTMCEVLKVSGPVAVRPYLYLTRKETQFGSFGPLQIAIQSSGLSAKYAARTKEWYPDRFQTIVRSLQSKYRFVQVGAISDPLLEEVIDMRGKTTIRETAAILHNSLIFIGLAGFLQHLARSVNCRSVIIYGGRELPSQTGYGCNENVTDNPSCSPCWLYDGCEYSQKCMNAITPEVVTAAVLRQIARHGSEVPVDNEPC